MKIDENLAIHGIIVGFILHQPIICGSGDIVFHQPWADSKIVGVFPLSIRFTINGFGVNSWGQQKRFLLLVFGPSL
jgi:hypothetical protein